MTKSRGHLGAPAAFDTVKPDPDKVGGIGEAPFVRLPDPSILFAARAKRLVDLSAGNPLEAYMLFLSRIVAVQDAARAALRAPRPLPQWRLDAELPLTKPLLYDDPGFAKTLDWILANAASSDVPPEARDARDRLLRLEPEDRLALAADVFDAIYQPDRLGECLYAAAALQLYLSCLAASLDEHTFKPGAVTTCPCCGGVPVSSLVVGWTQASKARYLCCSLCSTLWNYVRIKCAACKSTDGISYYAIEGGDQNVAAESCTTCRTYLKHLHQHADRLLDPFADDVASYGLDLLVKKQGFQRSGLNPLFVMA